MKRETIIWQIITLALSLFLILTIRTYLQDKNEIEAEAARANCLITVTEKNLDLTAPCADIKTYKLQDSAKGI